MRNLFISNLALAERIFPVAVGLPGFMRSAAAGLAAGYMRRRLATSRFPDRINLFITARCNLGCPHCFISPAARKSAFEETQLDEYLKLFSSFEGKVSQMLFTGGEPCLRSDLGAVIAAAGTRGDVREGMIFTNGTLTGPLVEAVEIALAESDIRLGFQISVDGNAGFHDIYRGREGAFDLASETASVLRKLKAEKPARLGRIAAATALSRRNLPLLPAVIEEVRSAGFTHHTFVFVRSNRHHLFRVSDPSLYSEFNPHDFEEYLTPAEMESAIEVIDRHLWSRTPPNLPHAVNRTVLETAADCLKRGERSLRCLSGANDLVILPDGRVAVCEMLRPFAHLNEFDWNLGALAVSGALAGHLRRVRGCWCAHDCSIADALPYSPGHLRKILAPRKPGPNR